MIISRLEAGFVPEARRNNATLIAIMISNSLYISPKITIIIKSQQHDGDNLKLKWQLFCLVMLALLAPVCGQQMADLLGRGEIPPNTVVIQDISFRPSSLTVEEGTTVTWINRDVVRHTVTSTSGLFDSGRIAYEGRFNYTFNEPGTYDYHCTIHPIMRGTIVVTQQVPRAVQQEEQPVEQQVEQQVGQQIGPQTGQQVSGLPSSAQQLVIVPEQPQPSISFSQFYTIEPQQPLPTAAEQMAVEEYAVSGMEPQEVYFGGPEQRPVSYSEYEALATTAEPNALWIRGSDSWVRYVQVPRGSRVTLLAQTQTPGSGTFYQIFPGGGLDRSGFYLYPFSAVDFYADDIGQHIIFFVKDNVLSNGVIIDVQPFIPPPEPLFGRSRINIISDFLVGYEVYVDDVYQFTEGAGGIPDGRSSLTVPGNMVHKITIRSGGLTYSSSRFFASGQTYTINVL